MTNRLLYLIAIVSLQFIAMPLGATEPPQGAIIEGVVTDSDGRPLPYSTIYIKGTSRGTTADSEGRYAMTVDEGEVDIVVQMLGYATEHHTVNAKERINTLNIALDAESKGIDEVVVSASGVGRLRRSAFNAVAVDTRALRNSTKSISDALSSSKNRRK